MLGVGNRLSGGYPARHRSRELMINHTIGLARRATRHGSRLHSHS